MSEPIDRRSVLKAIAASTAVGLVAGGGTRALAAQENLKLGKAFPFNFDSLKEMARRMVGEAYSGPAHPAPDILKKIDYDAWGKITYNTDHALFGDERFPITFFHLGMFFQKSVDMHVVEGGEAREIIYDQSYFDMPADSVARQLPKGAGFAGFRIQEPRDGKLDWRKNDWAAFLGASYFRAIGELYQYGLSARGLALDTAVAGKPEEFPDFTKFYIEKPETSDAAGGSLGRRRLQVRPGARQGRDHGHRAIAVPAQAGEPLRPGAAHVDVLVLRHQEADGGRLAAGSA